MFGAPRFQDLAEKYEEMLRLRRLDEAGLNPDPKAAMRALARRFPGALREIDELPMQLLEERAAEASRVAAGGRAPLWLLAFAGYHPLLRALIRVKTETGRWGRPKARELRGYIVQHYRPGGSDEPSAQWLLERAAAIHRPPQGRLNRWALTELASHLRLDPERLEGLLFPGHPA